MGSKRFLVIIGCLLLIFWVGFFLTSISRNHLRGDRWLRVPSWLWLGCDFECNYYAVRCWKAGGDPYESFQKGEVVNHYDYPPAVLPMFAWCAWCDARTGSVLWLAFLATVLATATVAAVRTRRVLGLTDVPQVLALVAVLVSFPVLFALERGNCDTIALLMILLAWLALRRSSVLGDAVCGLALALAAWCKIYPAVLLLGLLALRRWRAAAFMMVAGLIVGLVDLPGVLEFLRNIQADCNDFAHLYPWAHSLTASWSDFWLLSGAPGIAHLLPARAAWATLILPAVLWVSFRTFHCSKRERLCYPYFLWLTAAATFLPPVANDYSLIFLPLAAVALWDRRDPLPVHLLMAYLLLYWQPLKIPMDARLLLMCKLAGLGAVTWSLLGRLREGGQVLEKSVSEVPAQPA